MNNIILIGEFTEIERHDILSQFPNSNLIDCEIFVSDVRTILAQIEDCIKRYDPIAIAMKREDGEIELLRR